LSLSTAFVSFRSRRVTAGADRGSIDISLTRAAEATALAFSLQGQAFPRPMTYQFMASLVAAAGSAVRSVRVTQTDGQVFYAQVTLRGGAVVDARPSDAINLAAITGAPVLVASELLDLPVDPELRVRGDSGGT